MKPLLSNPYIVGNPIKTREMFFGREDDFQFVSRKIGEGKSNQIVVLCGERRSGKTSILFQIMGGRLGSSFLPILVDMQMLAGTRGDLAFFRAILRSGYAALQAAGIEGEAEVPAGGHVSVEPLMESFLAFVRGKAAGRTVLFLVDEYELIESKIKDGTLSESTVLYLAGVLESALPASFVFTGSANLEDRNPAIWKTLLGKSVYRKISYLSHRDAVRLITEPLKDSVIYPQAVVESIYRLTGGQPFYTQVICQNLTDLLIDEGRADPSSEDLERIVREIVANPLPQMIYTWNSFPPWSRIMLSSLASSLEDASRWADSRRVIQYVWDSKIALPFSRERANVLLEDAYHREFLEKNDAGGFRFRMDVLRRWIQREHSIWKVVKEADIGFRHALRSLVLPVSIGLGAAGVLVLSWFFLVPLAFPALTAWGRQAGLLPQSSQDSSALQLAQQVVKNVSFTANRGPFTVVIDGMYPHRADSELGLTWILVPSLLAGAHDFVATGPEGQKLEMPNKLVSQTNNSFFFSFPPTELRPAQIDGYLSAAGCDAESAALMKRSLSRGNGLLVVLTDPPGASVQVANDVKGVTPIALDVLGGYQPMLITREGYKPQTASFTAEAGKAYLQSFTLQANRSVLSFEGQNPANVYLDDVLLTSMPTVKTRQVPSGTHRLRIEYASGHAREEWTVDLVPGMVFVVKENAK